MCVWVSVTLSVNSPNRSDPWTDFYSWYLKRRGFTQGCAFWGSRWWIITFRVQSPPKSPLNRHFNPNMRKIQIAMSSDLCTRLTWNLTGSCSQQQRLRGWSRVVVKQFQDGGRPPFWKSIYRHISVKHHRIFMKFCTKQQILNWMNEWRSCIGQASSSTERISCFPNKNLSRNIASITENFDTNDITIMTCC